MSFITFPQGHTVAYTPWDGGLQMQPLFSKSPPPCSCTLHTRGRCSNFGTPQNPQMPILVRNTPHIPEGTLFGAPSSHPSWVQSSDEDALSAHDEGHCIGWAAPGAVSPGLILLIPLLSSHHTFTSSASLQITSFSFFQLFWHPTGYLIQWR